MNLKVKHISKNIFSEDIWDYYPSDWYILGDGRKFDSTCLALLTVFHRPDGPKSVNSDNIIVEWKDRNPGDVTKDIQKLVDANKNHYEAVMKNIATLGIVSTQPMSEVVADLEIEKEPQNKKV